MANTHKYDIVVAVGEYQQNGQTKKRNRTIGKIMVSENGREFAMLDPFFNLSAVPRTGDMVIVSLFTPRDAGSGRNSGGSGSATADDSLPF